MEGREATEEDARGVRLAWDGREEDWRRQVEFLDETLKFYQDPQLNIDAQQSRICKSLRTTWGIPETVQQSRSSPRPTQPTTPISDLISTFPAAHLRPDASRPREAACTRHHRNGGRAALV